MARQPKPNRQRDRVTGLFERGRQEHAIATLIEKATDRAIKRSLRKGQARILTPVRRKRLSVALAKTLTQALKFRHSVKPPKGSVKLKAPDTGGRPFHFRFYSISKSDAQLKPAAGGRTAGSGRAAAHHGYIERELAVEAIFEPGGRAADGPEADKGKTVKVARTKASSKGAAKGKEAGITGDIEMGLSAGAGQSYIERFARDGDQPARLKNGEIVLGSFGNIADSFEGRIEFWDLLAEHETMPNARVQNRVIVELPHESTPAARRAILNKFMEKYEELGLRYHVAIHAPGRKNDERNFHAHIVFSERPAKRMVDPATGKETWDFAITETYKGKNRIVRIKHPFRQNRLRELQEIHFVEKERKRFSDIVNAEMKKIDKTVKFDPRSYKGMGLEVAPIASINRILGDQIKARTATVLDPAWTQRLIAAEIARMVEENDRDAKELIKLDKDLSRIETAGPSRSALNRILPKALQLAPDHQMTRGSLKTLLNQRLAHQKARLEDKLLNRAERVVYETIRDATDPKKFEHLTDKSVRTLKNEDAKASLPDLANLKLLHEAAQEELQNLAVGENQSDRQHKAGIARFLNRWQTQARPSEANMEAAAGRPPENTASPARPQRSVGPAAAPQPIPTNRAARRPQAYQDERLVASQQTTGRRTAARSANFSDLSTVRRSGLEKPSPQARKRPDIDLEQHTHMRRIQEEEERAAAQREAARQERLEQLDARMAAFYNPALTGKDFVESIKKALCDLPMPPTMNRDDYLAWIDLIGQNPITAEEIVASQNIAAASEQMSSRDNALHSGPPAPKGGAPTGEPIRAASLEQRPPTSHAPTTPSIENPISFSTPSATFERPITAPSRGPEPTAPTAHKPGAAPLRPAEPRAEQQTETSPPLPPRSTAPPRASQQPVEGAANALEEAQQPLRVPTPPPLPPAARGATPQSSPHTPAAPMPPGQTSSGAKPPALPLNARHPAGDQHPRPNEPQPQQAPASPASRPSNTSSANDEEPPAHIHPQARYLWREARRKERESIEQAAVAEQASQEEASRIRSKKAKNVKRRKALLAQKRNDPGQGR